MKIFEIFAFGCICFVCGLVADAYVVEKQIDKTGVIQLDVKTYTCKESKALDNSFSLSSACCFVIFPTDNK